MADKTVVKLLGDYGTGGTPVKEINVLGLATDLAAAKVFAESLPTNLTDCVVFSVSRVDDTILAEAAPGTSVNIDRLLIIKVRDTATGKISQHSIPAPKAAILENTPNGERMTAAALAAYVVALNTATGKVYEGLLGWVVEKK